MIHRILMEVETGAKDWRVETLCGLQGSAKAQYVKGKRTLTFKHGAKEIDVVDAGDIRHMTCQNCKRVWLTLTRG